MKKRKCVLSVRISDGILVILMVNVSVSIQIITNILSLWVINLAVFLKRTSLMGTKFNIFRYAGSLYLPLNQILLWLQKDLLWAVENKEDVIAAWLKSQIQTLDKLEKDHEK